MMKNLFLLLVMSCFTNNSFAQKEPKVVDTLVMSAYEIKADSQITFTPQVSEDRVIATIICSCGREICYKLYKRVGKRWKLCRDNYEKPDAPQCDCYAPEMIFTNNQMKYDIAPIKDAGTYYIWMKDLHHTVEIKSKPFQIIKPK